MDLTQALRELKTSVTTTDVALLHETVRTVEVSLFSDEFLDRTDFVDIVSVTIPCLLIACGHPYLEIRIAADTLLGRLVTHLSRAYHDRLVLTLFKQLKICTGYSLSSCLSHFSGMCAYVKPSKSRAFLTYLMPILLEHVVPQALPGSLVAGLDRIFCNLGFFLTEHECKDLVGQLIKRTDWPALGVCVQHAPTVNVDQILDAVPSDDLEAFLWLSESFRLAAEKRSRDIREHLVHSFRERAVPLALGVLNRANPEEPIIRRAQAWELLTAVCRMCPMALNLPKCGASATEKVACYKLISLNQHVDLEISAADLQSEDSSLTAAAVVALLTTSLRRNPSDWQSFVATCRKYMRVADTMVRRVAIDALATFTRSHQQSLPLVVKALTMALLDPVTRVATYKPYVLSLLELADAVSESLDPDHFPFSAAKMLVELHASPRTLETLFARYPELEGWVLIQLSRSKLPTTVLSYLSQASAYDLLGLFDHAWDMKEYDKAILVGARLYHVGNRDVNILSRCADYLTLTTALPFATKLPPSTSDCYFLAIMMALSMNDRYAKEPHLITDSVITVQAKLKTWVVSWSKARRGFMSDSYRTRELFAQWFPDVPRDPVRPFDIFWLDEVMLLYVIDQLDMWVQFPEIRIDKAFTSNFPTPYVGFAFKLKRGSNFNAIRSFENMVMDCDIALPNPNIVSVLVIKQALKERRTIDAYRFLEAMITSHWHSYKRSTLALPAVWDSLLARSMSSEAEKLCTILYGVFDDADVERFFREQLLKLPEDNKVVSPATIAKFQARCERARLDQQGHTSPGTAALLEDWTVAYRIYRYLTSSTLDTSLIGPQIRAAFEESCWTDRTLPLSSTLWSYVSASFPLPLSFFRSLLSIVPAEAGQGESERVACSLDTFPLFFLLLRYGLSAEEKGRLIMSVEWSDEPPRVLTLVSLALTPADLAVILPMLPVPIPLSLAELLISCARTETMDLAFQSVLASVVSEISSHCGVTSRLWALVCDAVFLVSLDNYWSDAQSSVIPLLTAETLQLAPVLGSYVLVGLGAVLSRLPSSDLPQLRDAFNSCLLALIHGVIPSRDTRFMVVGGENYVYLHCIALELVRGLAKRRAVGILKNTQVRDALEKVSKECGGEWTSLWQQFSVDL